MSVIGNVVPKDAQGDLGLPRLWTPTLLVLAGIGLVVGYALHLSGFGGWMTLAVAGACLIAGMALWRYPSSAWLPAVVVAVEGAILCTMAFPGQLSNDDGLAALANMAIIAALIIVTATILRRPS